MTIAPVDTWEDPCPQQFHNISLNHNLFDFAATIRNLTIFYGCPLEDDIPFQHRFNCGTTTSNGNTYAYYLDESLSRLHRSELTDCDTSIIVPVNQSEFDELWNEPDNIVGAWNKGFEVMYQKDMISCLACRNSGGVCGSNSSSLDFLCFCPDHPCSKSCVVSVQVSQSSFDELQTERNEYMLEEWRFGFNVVYDFPAIFCERCDNLVEKCSNLMNESRYPVCKPGLV
ncbi:LEAF RUST 10 DISEASE-RESISTANCEUS RECEPTOR-LIKE PROTEIN KINASE-like 1.2 isoform X2 [Gossypium hirsutum]|uniref:LEAF RUST 10 DISEASE-RESISTANCEUS RECEPTOR-LIKE PROTEIN KINASE-like 1.2 isoform X2 n=1 Tax=Gossypium hirsutum TaxID=3635 RepID=A0A1U8HYL6_GOSHI|nr:LEAF RUST 10 DISEASE-RESISTANCE LOCUS RECEPTOR-LIKE PROTEIN KINASE-like 1.2 isoform X2 [Gossypium hirsutum]